ncbi:hypothetical protein LOZ51_000141 [Ophidiomyces ophidiicola]|nr:hypothetical protein LOZ55_002767 [Ophidiomyces ophidiicola]KAI1984785.1 hypothetical protein LOZ54_004441 [Ophidiomyces ophidiicola]KAI2003068.1 hypothetical protein LOZ51_000141 [Ophidiomyces ophidiicola]
MAAAQAESSRHTRMLSFHSNKSEKSQGSKTKEQLVETHREKEANRMHSHADPTRAINELQPSAIALEKSNLESLRSLQHKDRYGNVITDPDLSNPTRHRLERPLDTIRAFEAAIDGTYGRRMSYIREDSVNGQSRPTSFFGDPRGNLTYPSHGYNDQNSYYNQRQSRQESYADGYGNYGYNQYDQQQRGQRQNPRQQNGNGYAQNGQYQSYDSPSGSGNQSMDQLAQSTDPSSFSSSRDAIPQQQQRGDAYGFNGFGANPQLDYNQQPFQSSSNGSSSYAVNGVRSNGVYPGQSGAPTAPPAAATKPLPSDPSRKNSFLKGSGDKRKSWFKRFSRG